MREADYGANYKHAASSHDLAADSRYPDHARVKRAPALSSRGQPLNRHWAAPDVFAASAAVRASVEEENSVNIIYVNV